MISGSTRFKDFKNAVKNIIYLFLGGLEVKSSFKDEEEIWAHISDVG